MIVSSVYSIAPDCWHIRWVVDGVKLESAAPVATTREAAIERNTEIIASMYAGEEGEEADLNASALTCSAARHGTTHQK